MKNVAASGNLSPYGNVNNLRLSGVKSYMGMLGMWRAESRAMADIIIQKQESFYDRLLWVQQLQVSKCTILR